EQGDAWAQGLLGGMYYNGKGVKQDYHQAFLWTQKAADKGDATAQNRLGAMYYLGEGVRQNKPLAKEWF
ncbi:tetratricopeptide repeat protein, partial [Proteus mirabilis]|uniref:tetratricopeptide repeat protein n=1 Tax=Proteus mirabilis TaxID=584 RepID=UPI003F4AA717